MCRRRESFELKWILKSLFKQKVDFSARLRKKQFRAPNSNEILIAKPSLRKKVEILKQIQSLVIFFDIYWLKKIDCDKGIYNSL